ncbi:SIALI-17 repeat-containing surface protein [Streptococcus panodentis]|uniref:LPXTG cell wall anchor domain-containing protein n=1 Tax=Streptococcus panodentis TaxID=1581472 RepID=A0ABS5AX46_9STRE|nr:SIALI-17 repeat-containing surface protein [Streptococcus panodentis]MBP2621148.1 hypothetical protein [Streptococcus panodentis]
MTKTKLMMLGVTLLSTVAISQAVLAAEVEKQGTEIVVTEPEVAYSQEAAETYVNKDLTYHTEIPDGVEINPGDTLTYNLPEQLQWTTTQEFDVTSPEGEVVGNAVASNETQAVTTTFNDYFQRNPLNKQFDMTLKTMWKKEVVTENQKYDLNFNGTIVQNVEVKQQGSANPTEIVAKWGWQDKDDPSLVQWGGRVNFVKHELTDVNVSDTWDDNNEYVEGSMRLFELSSAEPWVGIREIPLSEAGVQFYKNGFKLYMPYLKNILSLEYKTRLKNKLQNPVNVLSFTAMGQEYSFEREIQVANATGSAKGNVRPFVWEVPPAPVHEIPEYTGGAVPLDPPVHDKPEWQGGVVPNDPPILNLPELDIPIEPEKPEEPEKPTTPDTPKTPENVPEHSGGKIVPEAKTTAVTAEKTANTDELPKTGTVSNTFLSILGISGLICLGVIFENKKKGKKK